VPSSIVHVDIPAKDTRQAAEFYQKLFDWNLRHVEEFNYTMFQPESGPGGGFVQANSPSPGNEYSYSINSLLIYVETDDIEGTLARAEALGGKTLLGKTEIPMTGWWAVFRDPDGSNIGLYTDMPAGGQGNQ